MVNGINLFNTESIILGYFRLFCRSLSFSYLFSFIDGNFTLGENIGDIGGLSLAYRAYKMSLNGEDPPVIDGLTGDQRFFLSWAQVWQRKYRDDALIQRLTSDPHSPSEFRVNGVVRNFDEWYEAFSVEEGDQLYLPPEERVRIW